MMKGNRGEWSELYTLFKLLADGRLYAADSNTNKINDIYYNILKVIRKQTDGKWEYQRDGNIKIVEATSGKQVLSVSIKRFKEQSDFLLKEMKNNDKKGSFEIPTVWDFAKKVKCNTLKAKSTEKADIILMVHDIYTESNPTLGFSIKSQLGQPSTLLNASSATNFTYKITGHILSDTEILNFNNIRYFKDKFKYLQSLHSTIKFLQLNNKQFYFNLLLIDTQLPNILSTLVKEFYYSGNGLIKDLNKKIIEINELRLPQNDAKIFYTYKIKELLTDIALGMLPAKTWSGNYEATGGYIIVKDDGDILCYHIYNRNEFRNYLFSNTKLETPSTTRHNYGKIINTSQGQLINLNLQIRFIK